MLIRSLSMNFLAFAFVGFGISGCTSEQPDNASAESVSQVATPRTPIKNCLFIILDASNASHFGHAGYHRDTSPNLDDFASRGIQFSQAHSQTSNTLSSAVSYMTGRYLPLPAANVFPWTLNKKYFSLASAFQAEGFKTAGFSGNPHIHEELGFDKGFDVFRNWTSRRTYLNTEGEDAAEGILDATHDWISSVNDSAWFSYVHLLRPHNPYRSPEPFLSRYNDAGYPITEKRLENGERIPLDALIYVSGVFGKYPRKDVSLLKPLNLEFLRNLYDGNIAYVDSLVGRFLDRLEADGVLENTLVIITGDHGEAFMQHEYLGHNATVYEDMTHVPLLFSAPPAANFVPSRVQIPVEMIDIFPTLAELFSLETQRELHGRSLVPFLRGEQGEGKPYLFSHVDSQNILSVRSGDIKMILERPAAEDPFEVTELYNLAEDPNETTNILNTDFASTIVPVLRTAALAYIRAYWSSEAEIADPLQISDETIEQLKSLGYLQE